jgi:hypothetical protein
MNKRSAMLIAAGLVMTLIVGGVAISVGLTGPTSSKAALRTSTRKAKPIVKVKKRTVTVHRQGEAVAVGSTSSVAGGSQGQPASGTGDGQNGSSDDSVESDHSNVDGDNGSGDDGALTGDDEEHSDDQPDEPDSPEDPSGTDD